LKILKSGTERRSWRLNFIGSPTASTLAGCNGMRSNCARLAFRFPTKSAKDRAAHTNRKFIQFLNSSRRSLFEDVSMLLVFERLGLLESAQVDELLWDCDEDSGKITNFSRAL